MEDLDWALGEKDLMATRKLLVKVGSNRDWRFGLVDLDGGLWRVGDGVKELKYSKAGGGA